MGTHVHPWWIHVGVWQSQCSIVEWSEVKIEIEKKKKKESSLQIIQTKRLS